MSAGIIILIVVLVLLAMIIGWVISVQRNLVGLDEICKNAMSQIGVQQNSRWDALGALADMVKQYDDHEYNTLKDIIAQRTNIGPIPPQRKPKRMRTSLRSLRKPVK